MSQKATTFEFAWNVVPKFRNRFTQWAVRLFIKWRWFEGAYQSAVVFGSPKDFVEMGRHIIEGPGRGAGICVMCDGFFLMVPVAEGTAPEMRDRFQSAGPSYGDKYRWLADTWAPVPKPERKPDSTTSAPGSPC